jgi:hypothetical protein
MTKTTLVIGDTAKDSPHQPAAHASLGMTVRMTARLTVGCRQMGLLVLLGGAGRPRTCDPAVMSRLL